MRAERDVQRAAVVRPSEDVAALAVSVSVVSACHPPITCGLPRQKRTFEPSSKRPLDAKVVSSETMPGGMSRAILMLPPALSAALHWRDGLKIAICTPHYADVHAYFALSLVNMIQWTVQPGRVVFNGEATVPDIRMFMRSSSALATVRNLLVKDALDWGANYLLWADADHNFPPDSLIRLLSHNLPVVGVNYLRRGLNNYPTAIGLDRTILWTTEEMANNREVSQVIALGLGLCLMDTSVFELLHEQAISAGNENFWPLFAFQPVPGRIEGIGEDQYFFGKLEQAGIGVFVDHALSWSIGHSLEKMVSIGDVRPQKDAF